jgi:hypothetical protein
MAQLMNNNSKLITVLSNRDCLRSIAPPTYIGTAPVIKEKEEMVVQRKLRDTLQYSGLL